MALIISAKLSEIDSQGLTFKGASSGDLANGVGNFVGEFTIPYSALDMTQSEANIIAQCKAIAAAALPTRYPTLAAENLTAANFRFF